jgi:pimeloyl-ACP methyl ester carboxylesterase
MRSHDRDSAGTRPAHRGERPTGTVVSRDGTTIGWFSSGDGPPLLLVHGGLGDHTRWDALRPLLEPHVTVHAMDRRGRGASGDASAYALEREFEDVAAVIDALAESSGAPIDVYCSSFGGLCTFGAVALTTNVARLALYEAWPPVDPAAFATPEAFVSRMEALLEAGQREEALAHAYRELVGLSEAELDAVRAQPSWSNRVAAAHTIPREIRAFDAFPFDPVLAAGIGCPTLLMVGTESPQWGPEAKAVARALPDARIVRLEGQGHAADLLAPDAVAAPLLAFLRGSA